MKAGGLQAGDEFQDKGGRWWIASRVTGLLRKKRNVLVHAKDLNDPRTTHEFFFDEDDVLVARDES